MTDSQKKNITRRRWRWGETRYELSVRGNEIFVDTFPTNLTEMRKIMPNYGYASFGYVRRFKTEEEAEYTGTREGTRGPEPRRNQQRNLQRSPKP